MKSKPAFTLVELVVVILILGILAAVAVPAIFGAAENASAAAELQSARAFFDAVQRYEAITGKLPNDAGPGVFPSDLDGYLAKTHFSLDSPAGGRYDWDGPPPHAVHRLKVKLPVGTNAATEPFYIRMETLADDGSATTGWITASGRTVSFWY